MKRKDLPNNVLIIDHKEQCIVDGCNKLGQHLGQYRKNGSVRRRATCSKHHGIQYNLNGWEHRQHRKTDCENKDGRLGFECKAVIIDPDWQLDVDHIDGNHKNNNINNFQTLCRNCHAIKTRDNKDYLPTDYNLK